MLTSSHRLYHSMPRHGPYDTLQHRLFLLCGISVRTGVFWRYSDLKRSVLIWQQVTYFWRQFEGQTGSCVAPKLVADLTYLHSIISIVADWTLAIFPIILVRNLEMNARTKRTLAVILGMGAM